MNLTDREQALVTALEEMEIIDCHEHLFPEANRVAADVDVLTLFAHYTAGDLRVAGMSNDEEQAIKNHDVPLDRRWEIFEPYWEQIRWGSYSRAALLAARKFYGADDINRDTYQSISEKMKAANTPGIYQRVLGDACKIRVALTQCMRTDLDSDILVPLMPLPASAERWAEMTTPGGAAPKSIDDVLEARKQHVLKVKSEGAVGLKLVSNPFGSPSRADAISAFNSLRDGTVKSLPAENPLRDYIVDEIIAFASQQDLVIAVHTGYWGDFRTLDPLHMIPILTRHPNARFDIYHLGYPWVRECLMLGKGFANVWLNLCWTHIISQECVVAALDEAIDLVPMNKILGFGADYGLPVEKAYGHLVMAREDIARVLARRIERGQMTETQALGLAKKWLWDNPVALYGLDV